MLKIRGSPVGIGTSPKAKENAPLVVLAHVVPESHVELSLEGWILFPVPLDEAQERLVSSMISERRRHRMTLREIHPRGEESFEEIGPIRVEESLQVHAMEIGSMLQQKVDKIPASRAQGDVQREVLLEIDLVPVLQ
jgi:hypothetical protein